MKIYAIRHGQTKLNVAGMINGSLDDELTAVGIEQAKAAVSSVPSTIKRMYASPLKRTRQTAELLNQVIQVPITYHDELKEVNFGKLNGTPYLEQYKARHMMLDYDWRPTGEDVEDVKKRVVSILEKIKAENESEEALVVVHGGIIRMMHFLESGTRLQDEIKNASIHSFDLDKILS
jgi:broad specificity phosphatase PhoE